MKTTSHIGRSGAFRAAALTREAALNLSFADLAVVCGGIRCDRFDEAASLPSKVREHRSNDGYHFDAETKRTLPFGCEYDIKRTVDLYDGGARITADVNPANGGTLRHFELDPVVISGSIRRFGWQFDGEAIRWQDLPPAAETVLDTPFAPAVLAVESASGLVVEIGCGDDLWRHRPELPGNTPHCLVTAGPEGIRMQRTILDFAADAEVERRPWRWEYFAAWSLPADTAAAPTDADDSTWPQDLPETGRRLLADGSRTGSCPTSAPFRRQLRNRIRAARGDLRLLHADAGLCTDAAHTGRTGKQQLVHGNAGELLAFHQWGARQLAARGSAFRISLDDTGRAAHPGLAGALDRMPLPLD